MTGTGPHSSPIHGSSHLTSSHRRRPFTLPIRLLSEIRSSVSVSLSAQKFVCVLLRRNFCHTTAHRVCATITVVPPITVLCLQISSCKQRNLSHQKTFTALCST